MKIYSKVFTNIIDIMALDNDDILIYELLRYLSICLRTKSLINILFKCTSIPGRSIASLVNILRNILKKKKKMILKLLI